MKSRRTFSNAACFLVYQRIDEHEPIVAKKELRGDDWLELLRLAYTDREKAFTRYSDYYLSTNGQTYWSDTNQLSAYLPNYAQKIREQLERSLQRKAAALGYVLVPKAPSPPEPTAGSVLT